MTQNIWGHQHERTYKHNAFTQHMDLFIDLGFTCVSPIFVQSLILSFNCHMSVVFNIWSSHHVQR